MARRKRTFLEDNSDSSTGSQEDDLDEKMVEDDDPDARAERSLFEDAYQRKKRRISKDDMTYGVFAEDTETEEVDVRNGHVEKRLHFTQAPAFVTGERGSVFPDKVHDENSEGGVDAENDQSGHADVDDTLGKESSVVDHEAPQAAPEDKSIKSMGGVYSASHQYVSSGISSRGGLGSARLHLGSPDAVGPTLPEAFGSTSHRPQRSFLRDSAGSTTSSIPGTPKLSMEEKLHFEKLQGSFGARLMAKMGWAAGTGLGASAEGIVTPVESKLRPKSSMGLAFRGFKERTTQSKTEARRRGEIVSDDDEEVSPQKSRSKTKGRQQDRSDAWKKPKKFKVKVEHQTYEQIVQNAGQEPQSTAIGKIYDATSGELREVSIADISASWTPSTDTMRIPEVQHNLRLIVNIAKGDLSGLAREGKTLEKRKKWIQTEDARLRGKVGQEADLIARLQCLYLIVDEIKSQAQTSSSDYVPSLDEFSPFIDKLVAEFAGEYDLYCLDEIVIGAISPLVQEMLATWKPLQTPAMLTDVFRRWSHFFKFSAAETTEEIAVDVYGVRSVKSKPIAQGPTMTPYESLMWNIWLPKVRSCINNDWSPVDAAPAVQLYETWSTLLPSFIRDNIFDQLILPKVQKAVVEWYPRTNGSTLQSIVFPWLPHIGPRIEELLGEARRRVKSLLRNWVIGDEIPSGLFDWKEVFGWSEWEAMTLKYILPKLGTGLREDFTVNPRSQDMTQLNYVLQWRPMFRDTVFSQLLETEFIPKWLDVLHVWLVQPKVSYEEVVQWYAFWKGVFPQNVLDLPGLANGFTRGLQLMNKAIELGPDATTRLPRPDLHAQVTPTMIDSHQDTSHVRRTSAHTTEITFRSIVEEHAALHDLLFIPTGKAHEKSRMPLFKVSHRVDGKGGILVYILDDAVWVVEGDDYRAISLDEMVLRANRNR